MENYQEIVNKIADMYRASLKDTGTNASGKLSSFTSDFEINNNHFRIYFNMVPYWRFAENGRKPGKPAPVDAIEKWILIKPLVPSGRNGRVPTTRQLAYAISKSIGKKGTKGKHALRNVIYSPMMDSIVEQLKQMLIKDTIKKIVEEI